MNYHLEGCVLRWPEPADLDELYVYKNDPEIAALLGGFNTGYAMQDLRDWLEHHRRRSDEVLFAIAAPDNHCIGHVGLYNIDARVRMAELGILIGDRAYWGQRLGYVCTRFCLDYGFYELNLNRISTSVLAENTRSLRLFRSVGFRDEGLLRQAQYKNGRYLDAVLLAMLRDEYVPTRVQGGVTSGPAAPPAA